MIFTYRGAGKTLGKGELRLKFRKEIKDCLARHLKEIQMCRSEKVKPRCGRINLKSLVIILHKGQGVH